MYEFCMSYHTLFLPCIRLFVLSEFLKYYPPAAIKTDCLANLLLTIEREALIRFNKTYRFLQNIISDKFDYKIRIPAARQTSTISSGQSDTCTSPICAF